LSFGTGRHPTTAFCLRQLAAHRRPGRAQSFLDLGTGSGILSIAAAKLGYAPVEAVDLDPEAVSIARANARRNRVSGKIRFFELDVAKLPRRPARKHDVICANLISSLLVSERGRIVARLETGGLLVVAGILKTEFEVIRKAYESAGLQLRVNRARGEWQSGSFVWREKP
jgi:ribosomal protein L11 methyltransferase